MKSDRLEPEAVALRLEELRRLYVPSKVEEDQGCVRDRDLSPAAIARRLEELSALYQLAQWLHARQPGGE